MMRIVRCALPIVLLLAASTAAYAQSVVCHPIRRGESATQVARRLTGNGWNAYRPWFQIMNPSSRYIPKSQYNRIGAGWRACVIKPVVQRARANASDLAPAEASDAIDALAESEARQESATPDVVAAPVARVASESAEVARNNVDLTMLWLGAAMVVPWFGWRIIDGSLTRRKTTTIVMRHFADRFVNEFQRPLQWDYAERPLRTRVRYSTRRRRLDILLAPGAGRRYPNLTDHKKNVEYDVARVLQVLADESFICGQLYTQAGWLVVPFQFKAGQKQPGVTCISSF